MIPYSRQSISTDDERSVLRTLRSDFLTTGPEVSLFESELSDYIGCKEVVAVNSGTAALHVALLAHGVQPNEEVAVPALTFCATANAVMHCGAIPQFCDVHPDTLLMRGDLGPKITAMLPVGLFGQSGWGGLQPARPPVLIEDAAHSFGAIRRDGQGVGSTGSATFSFHPVKLITTGEGGAIAFDDPTLARTARILRNHGRDEYGQVVMLGFNYRMSDIQAALGRSQLRRMQEERWVERRRALALEYIAALDKSILLGDIRIPKINMNWSAWHLFPVLFPTNELRDKAKMMLWNAGYSATVHYEPVVPLHPFYRELFGYKPGMWPVAEDAASRLLSLPFWLGMPEDTVDRVAGILGAL